MNATTNNTTAANNIPVGQYREYIDFLGYAFTSLRSAANKDERAREAAIVRSRASKLINAVCKRATDEDRERAERMLRTVYDRVGFVRRG